MSAEIVRLPERTIRPDIDAVFRCLDIVGTDPSSLFATAQWAMATLENGRDIISREKRDATPDELRQLVNLATTACFALATFLGVPRDLLEATAPFNGGAA